MALVEREHERPLVLEARVDGGHCDAGTPRQLGHRDRLERLLGEHERKGIEHALLTRLTARCRGARSRVVAAELRGFLDGCIAVISVIVVALQNIDDDTRRRIDRLSRRFSEGAACCALSCSTICACVRRASVNPAIPLDCRFAPEFLQPALQVRCRSGSAGACSGGLSSDWWSVT